MLNKGLIGLMAAVLLIAAGNSATGAKVGLDEQGQKQKRPQGRKVGKGQKAQQPRKGAQRAGKGKGAGRRQMGPRHRGLEGTPRDAGFKSFDKWSKELTRAYKENDREKMGRLIRQMNQFKKTMLKSTGRRGRWVGKFHRKHGHGKMGRKGRRRGFRSGRCMDRGPQGRFSCGCCCRGRHQGGHHRAMGRAMRKGGWGRARRMQDRRRGRWHDRMREDKDFDWDL